MRNLVLTADLDQLNRLTSTGWSYDSAGNTTNDPQGRTFIYDAENKQTEVRDQYNTVIGQYFFKMQRFSGSGWIYR